MLDDLKAEQARLALPPPPEEEEPDIEDQQREDERLQAEYLR